MARQDHSAVTDEQRDSFLAALAEGKSIVDAAGSPSMRRKFYRLKDADQDFAAEWKRAYEEGTDVLVAEARRRGVEGWDEPVFHKGEQVATVRKFDSTLLMFLIKQRDPTYRENAKLEVTGQGGGPVEFVDRSASLAEVAAILRQTGALGEGNV